MEMKTALDSCSFLYRIPSAGITGVHHNTWIIGVVGIKSRSLCMLDKPSIGQVTYLASPSFFESRVN